MDLSEFRRFFGDYDIGESVPNNKRIGGMKHVCKTVGYFNSATKTLQRESVKMSGARIIFGAIISKHECTK